MEQVELEAEDEFRARKNWKGKRTWRSCPTLQCQRLSAHRIPIAVPILLSFAYTEIDAVGTANVS